MTKTDSKLMIWALSSPVLGGCLSESPSPETHTVNIEERPIENGAPAPEGGSTTVQPVEVKEPQWSPPNPSEIWDNLGISETISMGTPIFESPHQIAIAYGAFQTSDSLSAWAQKQRNRLVRMEWNVEAQWSDEQRHAYRIAREQDTLCAIYIPSSTESSLVIFERPNAQALLGDCQIDTPIPDITVSEIEAKKDASELARDIWQDRGIAPKDHQVFVVDINPNRLRYTIPAQTEGEGPKEVFDQVSKQVTQSGWSVEDQGNIGVDYWSWWARQEDRLCIQVGPIEVGLSTVQMDMYAASQSSSDCSSRLKAPSFETQTDSTKNEGPK